MSETTIAGPEPRTERVVPSCNSNSAPGRCVVCGGPADGLDARDRAPKCARHAKVRGDGGTRVERGLERSPTRIFDNASWAVVEPRPAIVHTANEGKYAVDHVEERDHVLRLVNYEDDDATRVAELVDFPWHQVEAIEYYPATEAHLNAPEVVDDA